MSVQGTFAFIAHCRADASAVMDVLDDVDDWPSWARPLLVQAQWERWGEGSAGGVGAVRKLGAWPVWIRELILTRDERGHTYTVISPAVFTHYLGSVRITDSLDGGVDAVWRITFTAKHSVMAPLLRAALRTTISGLLQRLVATAERRAQGVRV
ncbi:SRPBCC family protein [Mycobacterium sp. CVI_P3]|uniref:SRPBCC family protein n=1 Tax=Mycobacterium pinniadriaticum TaxID=2994102 RepID=A0ABT3SC47_9MYCO|nr:SRPBCC family protein [Mycobacterium pinniadriaticum]MCX2930677.1 SRPBCC family protein [Mycobacterium pinniadriaticum]MCX2937101.1 SRPBCC family protein [Mycobacterium pinniadriaticum]